MKMKTKLGLPKRVGTSYVCTHDFAFISKFPIELKLTILYIWVNLSSRRKRSFLPNSNDANGSLPTIV